MKPVSITKLVSLVPFTLLVACESESAPVGIRLEAMSFANSEWSEPVNLGPVVNSSAGDNNPTLSSDGLSLYFASDRPGGLGNTDIWVAHRTNTNDDTGWEAPVNLGPDVNTPDAEQGAAYVVSDRGGTLYFTRGALASNAADLYRVEVGRDGGTQGPAAPVTELNDPSTNDAAPTLRADGREIFFWSNRAGGVGGSDIWVSTRRSVNDPWSPPVNLGGPPFNTTDDELQPDLSHDGRTLLFTSSRPGGSGSNDIWMSTRTPSGH